jgi:pantoate--beta-alanine ligase
MMLEFDQPEALRTWLKERRSAGQRIGFVPTMGYLHEGHLSLIERASAKSDVVVLSVFVNPLQFGPGEDLERYPRDLPRDRGLAEARGVAALFVPSAATMYPPGAEVRVVPGDAASRWEGAVRPGHFTGVLTVVAKLFHLVGPDIAFFGQKDVQQAVLIRGMVRDLDWPIEIEVAPTVRNRDGLALSSRNVYLDPTAREQALGLSRALARAHQRFRDGVRAAADLRAAMDEVLRVYPALAVEYIAIVDSDRMQPIEQVDATTIVALAARVGATRLIDNIVLGKGL